jgi:alpha-glucoside transport system substrate-binding protein
MATAITDRPEVRAFVQFMASPEFGSDFAGEAYFISPNIGFDPANYGPTDDVAANIRRSMATVVTEALARGEWRFDASDIMPSTIGAFADDGGPGAFWSAMVQLADGDVTALQAMTQIEQTWSELDAGG